MVNRLRQTAFLKAPFDDSSFNLHTMPGRASSTLLIFVHGLNGSGYGTWGNTLELMFHQVDRLFDVAVFDYRSGLRLQVGAGANVRRWARQLAEHLAIMEKSYENVVLLGHSQGGIVVEAAVKERLMARALAREQNEGAIAALVLLGSPRAGTRSVSALFAALIPSLSPLRAFSAISEDIEEFFASNVDRLTVLGTNRPFHVPTFVGTANGDRVVEPLSASMQVPDRQRKTFSATHTSLVKASGHQSELIEWLMRVLDDVLEFRAQRRREGQHSQRQAVRETPARPLSPVSTLVTELLCDRSGIEFEEVFNEQRLAASTPEMAVVDARDVPAYRVDVMVAAHDAGRYVDEVDAVRDAVKTVRDKVADDLAVLGGICPVGPDYGSAEAIVDAWLRRSEPTRIYLNGSADLDGYRANISRLFRIAADQKAARGVLLLGGPEHSADVLGEDLIGGVHE